MTDPIEEAEEVADEAFEKPAPQPAWLDQDDVPSWWDDPPPDDD